MFFMKGVWLSIKPIEFQQLILKDKILGEGGGGEKYRLFSDLSMDMKWVLLSDDLTL